jgi:hypothetical protein
MYFYILPGPYRLGFGITSNHERRQKDYTGAWGGEAHFKYLFEGPTPHVKRLENIIKTMHRDMLWKLDQWQTEWLDNDWTPEQLRDFVLQTVVERHLQITELVDR